MTTRTISRRAALMASAGIWVALGGATAAYGAAQDDDVIVVTAQKRAQTLKEIPQSVTVVGGEALERLNATTFEQYLSLIPGLSLNSTTPGVNRLALRGVNTGGVASTVAVYVDETPFGSSTGLVNGAILSGNFDTFDVDRIEVLRGPQGTLYGANALGGVLKFVTEKPSTDAVTARVRAGVETTEGGEMGYNGAAVVNLPLGDDLALRGSGFYRKTGGYVDSVGTAVGGLVSDVAEDINGSESYGGRASLLYNATDNLSVRVSAVIQNLDSDLSSVVEVTPVTRAPVLAGGGFTRGRYADSTNGIAYRLYNGTVEWDVGFGTLTSATSYGTFDQTIFADATTIAGGIVPPLLNAVFGPFPGGAAGVELVQDQQTDQRKFTQELRLASPDNDRFEWMIGGYFTRETGLIAQDISAVAAGTKTTLVGSSVLADVDLDSIYKEYAGFANATLHIGDRFDLTFGGRFSHNEQVSNQTAAATFPLFLPFSFVLFDNASSEGVFTWSVAPRYEVSDNLAIYARAAKGYRPGGPNALPPGAPPGTETFDSDTAVSYEGGIKAETADGRYALDISGFYLDWKDIQLFTTIVLGPGTFGFNANGGSARSLGGELTATVRPLEGLTLLVNAAYTDAELTSPAPLSGGLTGDPLPIAPKYAVSLNGDYERPLGDDVTGYVGGTFRWQTSQSSGFTTGGLIAPLPGYEVVDLRAGVLFDRFAVELFARNITDSKALTSGGNASTTFASGASAGALRPRTIGLTLTAEL